MGREELENPAIAFKISRVYSWAVGTAMEKEVNFAASRWNVFTDVERLAKMDSRKDANLAYFSSGNMKSWSS